MKSHEAKSHGRTNKPLRSLSIQTVFWQQMTVDLGVTVAQLSNAQSAQLAGLATGCVFFIPFAVKYGRRPAYLASTAVLAAAAWWTSSMRSYPELIATAVVTGLAGAVNETAVQMTVRESGRAVCSQGCIPR